MTKAKETAVVAYKGFDESLRCRDFQFEVGKAYEHAGTVRACEGGFHACENPLDVLNYYPLVSDSGSLNRFARVTVGGTLSRHDGDSKIAAAHIVIDMELTLPAFVKTGVDWLLAATKGNKEASSSKREAKLAASGDSSQLAASGDSSKLAASGHYSQLAASGHYSQLAASGPSSQLAASGPSSQLAASGRYSKLAASGRYSKLAASGHYSKLAASGRYSKLAASGHSSKLAASGPSSQLAASGPSSQLAASGDSSQLAASGHSSQLEITGANSAAATVGLNSRVKAAAGTPVAICEYDRDGKPIGFATGFAGRDGIPADVWLVARDGRLVES